MIGEYVPAAIDVKDDTVLYEASAYATDDTIQHNAGAIDVGDAAFKERLA